MYKNRFSCRVMAKNYGDRNLVKEIDTPQGTYVEIPHNTQFYLQFRNQHEGSCKITVKINGEDMGSFQMDSSGSLERSLNDDAIFTAFVEGSWEDYVSKQGISNQDEAGLIEVTMTPEIVYHASYDSNILESYNDYSAYGTYGASKGMASKGMVSKSSFSPQSYGGYSGAKSFNVRARAKSVSSSTHDNVTVGGTGNSSQTFGQGRHLNLDTIQETTFKFRLVAPKKTANSGVRPLRSSKTPPRL